MSRFSPQVRSLALALGVLLAAGGSALADADNYRRALDATTWVLSKNSEGTSSGTGVLVDKERKLVITNAHVVGDSRSAVVFFRDLKDDRPVVEKAHYLENVRKLGVRGRVVAVDRKRDLALVELDKLPESAAALELAEESTSPGVSIDSIGNPGASEALWVYTSGKVRSVYLKRFRTGAGEHEFTVVETQSPLNTGDSGGPVVGPDGKLVGVVQAISKKGSLISYCVDITEVKEFLASDWKPAPLPIADVLDKTDLGATQHETGHFRVEVAAEGDAKQEVFITKETEYYGRADVRKIWSLAATLDADPSADTMRRLLEQSARTKLGGWSIEQDTSGKRLLIYVVKIDATATPDSLASVIKYTGKITAAMKKELEPKKAKATASETLASWLAD
ncbi:serine protease [Botrimarina sp.]|uniref:S1 family peptidase n=1 Tax=Botrimarina sp. TaxID=2795802 RepID=UPI0032EFD9EC